MHTIRWWLSTSSIVALLLGTWTHAPAANEQEWGSWGMHMMWGSWGIVLMLLICAAIIVGIVLLIRWLVTAGHPGRQVVAGRGAGSALDVLKERYASGEISKQEFFEEMRREVQ